MARTLTDKQIKFIDVLFDDDVKGDYVKAKKKAGFSDGTSTRDIVKSLKDEILEATRDHIIAVGPKAAYKLSNVIDNPADLGNREAIAASKEILDRAGVVKTDKMEIVTPGVFIVPAKGSA